jgi:hypothetical protein
LSGEPFPGWKELAGTILEAASLEPGVLLPQIPWFFVFFEDSTDAGSGRIVQGMQFNEEIAERLFGIVGLARVFACDDTRLADVPAERMEEVRFVRRQLAGSLAKLASSNERSARAE